MCARELGAPRIRICLSVSRLSIGLVLIRVVRVVCFWVGFVVCDTPMVAFVFKGLWVI